MRVIGFNFDKISIEKKKKQREGQLRINTNIEIIDLHKEEVDIFKDRDVYNFEYEFKINYEPNFAEIIFKGGVLTLIEDKDILDEIKKEWKDKKLPEKIKLSLMNLIFSRCNLKALQLEEDMGITPHIPSPRFTAQSQPQITTSEENQEDQENNKESEQEKEEKTGNS